jgi:serine/threonine protein kinase
MCLLGEGGQGKVYQVRNRVDRNIYCIKLVKLSRRNRTDNEKIKREVEI